MKLLIFAHIPPPHHGQSYMVKLMLDALGGDVRKTKTADERPIQCYHVNSRFSDEMTDIGEFQAAKVWLVLRYCAQAIWCRLRYGVRTLYYVPAPGKRAALYRDWIVMFLCRPFFPRIILHWHAIGLGDWVQREGTWLERWITHRLLSRPHLSLSLAIASMRDALWFRSRHVEILPNGIPDPCPDFAERLLPLRRARLEARQQLAQGEPAIDPASLDEARTLRVLYIAHCTREKGVFDALESVALFNRQNQTLRVHLTVAGAFLREEEETEFQARIRQPDLASAVTYAGFVSGKEKQRLFEKNDCLCFPTYYNAESFGLVIVEAMAFGLSIITTRWRAIPELLPADYPGFVAIQSPDQIAAAFGHTSLLDLSADLRARYLATFSEQSHAEQLRALILTATTK